MKIVVISDDAGLFDLCLKTHSKLALPDSRIVIATAHEHPSGDVFLWDLDCNPAIPLDAGHREPQRDLFVVQRDHLDEFLDRFPHAAARILLKPVNPAALEVFLDQLIVHSAVGEGDITNSAIPADGDVLLQCLMHACLRLQEFEQDRTNFWARAAHELRAPLTAASGYCQLLLEERMGSLTREQKEVLERAQHSLRKLIRMSSTMFQLAVGKQMERKLELKRVRIQDCIKHAVTELQGFANEKDISLIVKLEDPGRQLYAEPAQIEQVVVNLLENACKFTPRNGVIEVRGYGVRWSGENYSKARESSHETDVPIQSFSGYRVDISDTGPGIESAHLPHIFDEYVSYGKSGDRWAGGLGLAICKMILQAHHGEIWAETSRSGTVFSLVLPFNPPVIQQGVGDASERHAAASAR